MGGALSTITKFETLLRTTSLTPTRFSALCSLYGIRGMSDASINRALQKKDFSIEAELAIRDLVVRIESLITKAQPFAVPFEDIETTKLLLDLLTDGHELSVQILLRPNKKDSNSNTSAPTACLD